MTPGEAARVLGMSPDNVRALHDKGTLAGMRTVTGRRLFTRQDVEALAKARAAK